MSSFRLPISVLSALAIVFVAQAVYYYPQLPERVASHFDASGTPNGWMSKSALVLVVGGIIIFVGGLLTGISFLIRSTPDMLNIPHKEYWLAAERRTETLQFCSSTMLWIAVATLLLFLVIQQFVYQMNIRGDQTLGLPMIPTLVVFLGAVAFLATRMFLKFRNAQ